VRVKNKDLAALSVDQLWRLRTEIERLLSSKMEAEKHKLEQRLAQLDGRTEPKKKYGDLTRRFVQNTATRSTPRKLGQDEASNRAGSARN